jgi:LruC domain-containing protein
MNVDPSLISSVTGSNISENYITLDGKGLEAGHSNGSTIIVFDDAFDNIPNTGSLYVNTERGQPIVEGTELLITITFSNPVDASLLGSAPFNPFIIVNGDRGREVHLADQVPTDLVNSALFGSIHDDSNVASGRTYRTENNLPWGINIIHEFRYPEEKKPINTAYNFFNTWALGSGATYEDWYKDNSGYRNTNNIIIN